MKETKHTFRRFYYLAFLTHRKYKALCLFVVLFYCLFFIVSCSEVSKHEEISSYFENAKKYVRAGMLEKSIEELEKITKIIPYYGEIYTFIGGCYIQLNKIDEAIPYFKKAVVYQPYDIHALKKLCQLNYKEKKIEDYIYYCKKCIDIEDNFIEGYMLYIDSLMGVGKREVAKKVIEKLKKVNEETANKLMMKHQLSLP